MSRRFVENQILKVKINSFNYYKLENKWFVSATRIDAYFLKLFCESFFTINSLKVILFLKNSWSSDSLP